MSKRPSPSNYAVGRGRPPKHSQFKKGQSGNPGGKRKRPPTFVEMVSAVMATDIVVTIEGKRQKTNPVQALLLRQVQDGLRGNARSAALALAYFKSHGTLEAPADHALAGEDQAILARAFQRRAVSGTLQGQGAEEEEDDAEASDEVDGEEYDDDE
jgi:hypothetical protein